jgi:hypothetical protein
VRAITCPICELLFAERDDDGAARVRRRGRLVAIVAAGVIPCRGGDCTGFVAIGDVDATAADAVAIAGAAPH